MSLRARLLAAFAYVLVLVIVALAVPLSLNLSKRVDAEVRAEAAGQAQLVAASAGGRFDDTDELDRLAARSSESLGGRVVIVDRRGRLLADSAGEGLESESYSTRPEIAAALRGGTSQGERHSDDLGQDLLFTAVPVVDAGRTVGAVRVTQSVDSVNDEVRNDTLALVGVGAIALLLGLGVAALLAGSLSRPLRALAATARRIAGGDLDARAKLEGPAEQREVAAAFNDMTERLSQALSAQREFVANASHQLRTPLTGLKLRLESAGLQAGDPELERELAAAEREADRLAKLLDELLTLAREADRPATGTPVDLGEVAAAAAERWAGPADQSGHTLELASGPEACVLSSTHDLAIVLDNLIENALNYSPPGTAVTIEWSADGDRARLAVTDEGPGVAPAEDGHLFERFYRGEAGRRGAPGTGLGLAIVETLARRWGGGARIASRPEGGARAELELPVVAAARGGAGLPTPDPSLDEPLEREGYARRR
ncbi:MAG TPA: ATP-binding protein [Thermoleophilaceae bacterium]|jgi:signal transduction histidine kinase